MRSVGWWGISRQSKHVYIFIFIYNISGWPSHQVLLLSQKLRKSLQTLFFPRGLSGRCCHVRSIYRSAQYSSFLDTRGKHFQNQLWDIFVFVFEANQDPSKSICAESSLFQLDLYGDWIKIEACFNVLGSIGTFISTYNDHLNFH